VKRKRNNHFRSFLFFAMFLYAFFGLAFALFFPNQLSPAPTLPEMSLQSRDARFAQAYRTWQIEGIENYRYTLLGNDCETEILVENGTASITANTCSSSPEVLTISELFDEILAINSVKDCGLQPCYCAGHIYADAYYDKDYGYPFTMRIWVDYFPSIIIRPNGISELCTLVEAGRYHYTIENFEVLQRN
jgi:hypothetical protein